MGQTDNGSDLVFLAVVDKSNEVYCTRHRAARCHFSIRSMLSTQLDMYFEHGGQEVAKGKSLWTQFEWSFKWFRPQATITTMNAKALETAFPQGKVLEKPARDGSWMPDVLFEKKDLKPEGIKTVLGVRVKVPIIFCIKKERESKRESVTSSTTVTPIGGATTAAPIGGGTTATPSGGGATSSKQEPDRLKPGWIWISVITDNGNIVTMSREIEECDVAIRRALQPRLSRIKTAEDPWKLLKWSFRWFLPNAEVDTMNERMLRVAFPPVEAHPWSVVAEFLSSLKLVTEEVVPCLLVKLNLSAPYKITSTPSPKRERPPAIRLFVAVGHDVRVKGSDHSLDNCADKIATAIQQRVRDMSGTISLPRGANINFDSLLWSFCTFKRGLRGPAGNFMYSISNSARNICFLQRGGRRRRRRS
eukprot:Selendium_serpulae@DN5998_c0_g1_i1.p1